MKELDSLLDDLHILVQNGHEMMEGITFLKLGDGGFRFDFELVGHDNLTLSFTRSSYSNDYWFMIGSLEAFDNDTLSDFLNDAIKHAKSRPGKPKVTGLGYLLGSLNLPHGCMESSRRWAIDKAGHLINDIFIVVFDGFVSICSTGISIPMEHVKREILDSMVFNLTEDAYNCFFNHTSYSYNHKERLSGYMREALSRGYDTVTLMHEDGVYVFGVEGDLIYLDGDKNQHNSLFVSQYNKVLN